MVLSVPISAEAEARLKEKADLAGVDIATYASRQLELITRQPRSLREISGPIAEAFKESGMTEDKLGDLLEEEKHAMRAAKRVNRT